MLTLGSALARNATAQRTLLAQLQAAQVHLAGYLPTQAEEGAAWLLLVPDSTDLQAAVHGVAAHVRAVSRWVACFPQGSKAGFRGCPYLTEPAGAVGLLPACMHADVPIPTHLLRSISGGIDPMARCATQPLC